MSEQSPLTPQPAPKPAELKPYIPGEEAGGHPEYPPAPPGFDDWEEDSGLPPVAVFDEPGDFVAGHFRAVKADVGKNKSRMYYLALHPTKEIIGVWGSTALDDRMDLMQPKPGDAILIQYLGVQETARGQNPVKVFRVRLKRKAGAP